MSASHCGCDYEANHLCDMHASSPLQQAIRAGSKAIAAQEAPAPVTVESIANAIQRLFPGGHPSFLPITLGEIKMHAEKNHDYAQGGDPLGNFKRVGAILALYPDLDHSDPKVVALIYMLKQLDATLWGLNSKIVHKVEGLKERMGDVSVYAKLVICLLGEKS